jgi:multidrug resistance efflux pump
MTKRHVVLVTTAAGAVASVAWFWPRGDRTDERRLPGTVEVQEVRLGSKVGGRVAAVAVREGDLVEPGTVLVRFDAPDWEAKRDQAAQTLAAAKATWGQAAAGRDRRGQGGGLRSRCSLRPDGERIPG